MRRNYATVKVPAELAAELDALVLGQGYHSRAEVVNDAIRRFIEEKKRLNETALQKTAQAPVIRTSQV